MSPLIVVVIVLVASWISFMVGVLFVCVVTSARERRRKAWQPPQFREVSR